MVKILGWLILIGILFYGGYVALHVSRVRLNYTDLKDKATSMMNPNSQVTFNRIPGKLMERAREKNIPLEKDEIELKVDRWERIKILSFSYRDSIMVFNKPWYFDFSFADTLPMD